jgi:hypothetical protein
MQDVISFSLIVAAYMLNRLTTVQSHIGQPKLFARDHNLMQRKGLHYNKFQSL